LTESLSPPLLGVLDDDVSLTIEELRHIWKLTDGLPLYTEANARAAKQDEHSLIEGLKVIYG
jgi:hypothetical protein